MERNFKGWRQLQREKDEGLHGWFSRRGGKEGKERKHKEVGLLVELVMIKVGQNLVEERMLLRVEKEDVGQLVPLVKLTKGERDDKMNWVSILKYDVEKARSNSFFATHFKLVKKSLLDVIENMPSGQRFFLKDDKFKTALIDKIKQNIPSLNQKESVSRGMANAISSKAMFVKLESFLARGGKRIVDNSNLAERVYEATGRKKHHLEFIRK